MEYIAEAFAENIFCRCIKNKNGCILRKGEIRCLKMY